MLRYSLGLLAGYLKSKKEAFANLWVIKLRHFVFPYKYDILTLIFCFSISIILEITISENLISTFSNYANNRNSIINVLVIIFLMSINSVVFFLIYFYKEKLGAKIVSNISFELFSLVEKLYLYVIKSKYSSDFNSRLIQDILIVRNYLNNNFFDLVYVPILSISMSVYLFIKNPFICIIGIGSIFLITILSNHLSKNIGKHVIVYQSKLSEINQTLKDTINCIQTVKINNLFKSVSEKYNTGVKELVRVDYEYNALKASLDFLTIICKVLPYAVSGIVGGYFCYLGNFNIGVLTSSLYILSIINKNVSNIPNLFAKTTEASAVFHRLWEILGYPSESLLSGKDFSDNVSKYDVEFEDVIFNYYDDNKIVLNKLSFKIPRNKSAVLVGFSGSGKSTIFKIICGLYNEYDGAVKILGNDIKNWNLLDLRKNISLLGQNMYMFPTSIKLNISCGDEKLSMDSIVKICADLHIHDFISSLPNGYDTVIGDGGYYLSDSQKQLISLARTILKKPKLFLFDEPTSKIDFENEEVVNDVIKNLIKSETTLIISHKLNTIKSADIVIVLHNGQVNDIGTHDELIQTSHAYKRLYDSFSY